MPDDKRSRAAPARPPSTLDEEAAERQAIGELGRRDFLERYQGLTKRFSTDAGNPGSYQCVGCERCANCMFSIECDSCYHCTHCRRCALCTNCSHCVDSRSCHACAYCVQSENCANSAYLELCQNLSDCTYCFGCVGISKKDFHILNVELPRKEYFRIVGRLRKEMGIR